MEKDLVDPNFDGFKALNDKVDKAISTDDERIRLDCLFQIRGNLIGLEKHFKLERKQ